MREWWDTREGREAGRWSRKEVVVRRWNRGIPGRISGVAACLRVKGAPRGEAPRCPERGMRRRDRKASPRRMRSASRSRTCTGARSWLDDDLNEGRLGDEAWVLRLPEVREEHLNPCTCRLDIDGGGLRELDGVGLARAQLRDPAATDRLLAEPYAAVVLDGSAEPCDPVGEFAQVGAEVAVVSDVARVEADSPVAAVSAADETDVGELAPCDVRDESDNPVLVAHEAPP